MPESQGGLQMGSCFGVGEDRERFFPRHAVRDRRLFGPSGPFEVMGVGGRFMSLGQCIGGAAVQKPAPDAGQALIDRPPDDLMGETHSGGAVFDEAAAHHGFNCGHSLLLRTAGHRSENLEVELGSHHRGRGKHLLSSIVQIIDAGSHQFLQTHRHLLGIGPDSIPKGEHKQRIPPRHGEDPLGQPVVVRLAIGFL
jgi:hypothetical protein